MLNLEKKLCEIVKANEGSRLSYDKATNEFVITFKKHGAFSIPGDCEFGDNKIYKTISGKFICRVRRE